MDIWAILIVLWNIISSLSVIITLLCFIYPAGAYPIISFAFKKIKERKLNQTKMDITLIYDFKCLDVDLNTSIAGYNPSSATFLSRTICPSI